MKDNVVPQNSTPIPMEYPKRMTAINPITGALIKSKSTNQDEYAKGWDLIFGKKFDFEVEDCGMKYVISEDENYIPSGISSF